MSMQKAFSGASYSASVTTAAGGAFTINEWAMVVGIVLALLTFVINWIYKAAQNKRDKEQHELNKELIQQKLDELRGSGVGPSGT